MIIKSYKLFENVQQSKKVLRELDIPETNEDYVKLRELLGNNLGYLGKFTQWLFQDNIPLSQLETLLIELRNIKLDKPINQFDTAEDLYDYITELKADTQINQVIQLLPRHARNVVDNKVRNLIRNNLRHIDHIKHLYKTRSSAYRSSEDIYQNTITWINNVTGGWNADAIDYLPEELVYKDDFTLILHIDSYDRSCELGSAMWCISTDEYHWDEYTSNFKKQYFIYDFTRDIGDDRAMIGVTINLNGSVNVVHIRNNDMIDPSMIMEEYGEYLTPYDKEDIKSQIGNDIGKYIEYGLIDDVMKLIKQGHDPSVDDNLAIQVASENGHTDIVKELLKDNRVDPSDGNNYAIRTASRGGHLEVVKLLLQDKRVDPSTDYNYAIRWASSNGHLEIVKELLKDNRVDPSVSDNFAIRWASQNGHLDVVRVLLKDDRVDPSDDNNQAIRTASLHGYLEIVKLLLQDKRVDPSDNNNQAIRTASLRGYLKIVKELLKDNRVDPSDGNNYAIRMASHNGHLEVVKELLKDKRVGPSTDYNYAIRWASSNGHLEIVKELLKDNRVDPSVSDGNNYAIQMASENGHKEIVELLKQDPRSKRGVK